MALFTKATRSTGPVRRKKFDRTIYFDCVRVAPFHGSLTQEQVDGQNFILSEWEHAPLSDDLRHLAYPLATTLHETAATMMPIEEYGKGAGQPYGNPDPITKKAYYGRGYVQLTWADNYKKATKKLNLDESHDLYWFPEWALDPSIASQIMFKGMWEGWFRSPNTLKKFFDGSIDDPYGAREIINGDKSHVPDWSDGKSIGNLIKSYHYDFMSALEASLSSVLAV